MGKLLIGTVKGDLHDIGKDIFRGMMEANSFEVIDLGVDVPKETFVQGVEKYDPDIIGLSGVLNFTVETMKNTIDAIKEAGLKDNRLIILGEITLQRKRVNIPVPIFALTTHRLE